MSNVRPRWASIDKAASRRNQRQYIAALACQAIDRSASLSSQKVEVPCLRGVIFVSATRFNTWFQ